MIVRLAGEADVPAAAALERATFSEGADEAMMARMLSDGRHALLLAEEDGALLGYVWYEFVLDEGYVGNLAVAPEHRRKGVGRALAEGMLSDARERGLAFLTLEVRESNAPARALYEKTGFCPAGVRKNYYERPRENGVILTAFFPKEEEKLC